MAWLFIIGPNDLADPPTKRIARQRAALVSQVLAWVRTFASERCPEKPGPGHMNAAAEPRRIREVVAPRIESCTIRLPDIVSGTATHHHLAAIRQLIDLNHGGAARVLLLRDPRFFVEFILIFLEFGNIFPEFGDAVIAGLSCLRAIRRCDRRIGRGAGDGPRLRSRGPIRRADGSETDGPQLRARLLRSQRTRGPTSGGDRRHRSCICIITICVCQVTAW